MLEGKAGNDFRILKWVFIFEVALQRGAYFPAIARLPCVKELAAHNLTVRSVELTYLASVLPTACPAVRIDHCFVLECSMILRYVRLYLKI